MTDLSLPSYDQIAARLTRPYHQAATTDPDVELVQAFRAAHSDISPLNANLDDNDDPIGAYNSAASAIKYALNNTPPLYRDKGAIATDPTVWAWVQEIADAARSKARNAGAVGTPHINGGPSLLLVGPTGTGKTHQAYGAMRTLAVMGVRGRWVFATAADVYARLRPRHQIDSEQEFQSIADAPLLVVDDLGAAKPSEWTEEVNYRLVNHRYEQMLPTLVTSNVPTAELGARLGDRVASRLMEMTTLAVLKGADRRRSKAAT